MPYMHEITQIEESNMKKIPQMKDSGELFQSVIKRFLEKGLSFPCLVPNVKGFEKALAAGVQEIALFTATSNEFNRRNINTDIDGSFVRMPFRGWFVKESGMNMENNPATPDIISRAARAGCCASSSPSMEDTRRRPRRVSVWHSVSMVRRSIPRRRPCSHQLRVILSTRRPPPCFSCTPSASSKPASQPRRTPFSRRD